MLLESLEEATVWTEDLVAVDVSPDPDDNRILGTAIAGGADLIVSGDQAGMLEPGEVSGVPIITAREAVRRLELEPGDPDVRE